MGGGGGGLGNPKKDYVILEWSLVMESQCTRLVFSFTMAAWQAMMLIKKSSLCF